MKSMWAWVAVAAVIGSIWCVKSSAQAPAPTTAPGTTPIAALEVFQDLDEATSRIPQFKDKPFQALIEASAGFFQPETIIFKDAETDHKWWR